MRYSPTYLWIIALGILPIGALCGLENQAQASCGDYVHIISQKSNETSEDKPKGLPCPCQGPNCHQQLPDAPIPAPAAPVSQLVSSDFILNETTEIELGLGSFPFEAPIATFQPGCSESIFHPPR